jgi:hypothetical protein
VLLIWAHYTFLTSHGRYADEDFMGLWSGGRALLEGLDPYESGELLALRRRYGSTWMPDAQTPLPLWTCVLLIPFSALDLDWAAAAWLVFSEVLLGWSVIALLMHVEQCRVPAIEFCLLALGAFTSRGVLTALTNGQLTMVLVSILTLFLVLIKRNRDFAAGFVLAFLAVKPTPFVFFVPLLGLWLIWQRRWRVVGGAIAGGAVLLSSSWLLQPGWLAKWLAVRGKTGATYRTPTVWGLAYGLSPNHWPLIGMLLAILVTAVTSWFVFRNRRLDEVTVVSLALVGSLVITPYLWAYEHALLVVPLVVLFARVNRRWLARLLWFLLAWFSPWLLYWVANRIDADILSSFVPLLVGGVLALLVSGSEAPPTAEKQHVEAQV